MVNWLLVEYKYENVKKFNKKYFKKNFGACFFYYYKIQIQLSDICGCDADPVIYKKIKILI